MKKLKMARSVTLTFEEGCNKYLDTADWFFQKSHKSTHLLHALGFSFVLPAFALTKIWFYDILLFERSHRKV